MILMLALKQNGSYYGMIFTASSSFFFCLGPCLVFAKIFLSTLSSLMTGRVSSSLVGVSFLKLLTKKLS